MGTFARYLLAGLFALAASGCIPMLINEAETPATRGQVLDGVDGEPIAAVEVSLFVEQRVSDPNPIRVSDITDENGEFLLEEQSRRRVVIAMPGSHLVHFPVTAHDDVSERSAYTVVTMPSRTRAGRSDRHTLLLLLPENPRPLPSGCPEQGTVGYALHAAERLPTWQEETWFRQRILNDTATLRQFADGLASMLRFSPGSPECSRKTVVKERMERARQNVRTFIEQAQHY
jgi:hypothetical protein